MSIKTAQSDLRIPRSTVRDRESIVLFHGSQFVTECGICEIQFDYDYAISHSMRPPPVPTIHTAPRAVKRIPQLTSKQAASHNSASIRSEFDAESETDLDDDVPAAPLPGAIREPDRPLLEASSSEHPDSVRLLIPAEEPTQILYRPNNLAKHDSDQVDIGQDRHSSNKDVNFPYMAVEAELSDVGPPVQTIDPRKLSSQTADVQDTLGPISRRGSTAPTWDDRNAIRERTHERSTLAVKNLTTVPSLQDPPSTTKSVRFKNGISRKSSSSNEQGISSQDLEASGSKPVQSGKRKGFFHETDEAELPNQKEQALADNAEDKENLRPSRGKGKVEHEHESEIATSTTKIRSLPLGGLDQPHKRRRRAVDAAQPLNAEHDANVAHRDVEQDERAGILPTKHHYTDEQAAEEAKSESRRRRTIVELESFRTGVTGGDSNTIVVNPTPKKITTAKKIPVAKSPTNTAANISKRQRRPRASSKIPPNPKIILSNFEAKAKVNAMRIIGRLGGEVVEDVFQADILCVPDNQIKKSTKFVLAIILGKYIVSERFIEAAQTSKLFPDPSAHLPRDKKKEREWKFNLTNAVARNQEIKQENIPKLLDSCSIFLTNQVQQELGELLEEFRTVVQAMGAKQVSKRLPTKMAAPLTSIVIASVNDPEATKVGAMNHRIYNKDVVIMAALRGKLELDSDEFMLEIPVKQEPESQ